MTDAADDWGRFHDAVLYDLTVIWEAAEVRIRTSLCAPQGHPMCALIRVTGFTRLVVPRELPWGISKYVYEIVSRPVPDGVSLQIVAQSGDEIEIAGAAVHVETRTGRWDHP